MSDNQICPTCGSEGPLSTDTTCASCDDGLVPTLEARLAQWEQAREDAVRRRDRTQKILDAGIRNRQTISFFNEQSGRVRWADTQIGRIKAAIRARDGRLLP